MISGIILGLATGDWRIAREGVSSIYFPTCLPAGSSTAWLPHSTKSHSFPYSCSPPGFSHYSFPCPCSPKSGNFSLIFPNLGLGTIRCWVSACSYVYGNYFSVTKVGCHLFSFWMKAPVLSSTFLQTFHLPLPSSYNSTFKMFM